MIRALPGNSYYSGALPKGCVHCKSGRKLVLFVTGKCFQNCVYCPLSIEKRGKDFVWADELRVDADEDVIYEAEMIDAVGAGITGGEPALAIARVQHYVGLLKSRFRYFHVHLYTTTTVCEHIHAFEEAGIDELRFHVPPRFWGNLERSPYKKVIESALRTDMHVGIEIPVLPNKESELCALVETAFNLGVEFVNLNELEFSETNWESLRRLKYRTVDDVSSAAKGSAELALKILKQFSGERVHYCSASFKDAVQLRNRLLHRAKNVAKDYDVITEEGTLLRGLIYTDMPEKMRRKIIREFEVPKSMVEIEPKKGIVLIHPGVLTEIAKHLNASCYIVEIYPTADGLEVERIPL